jgi:hypothetical protein
MNQNFNDTFGLKWKSIVFFIYFFHSFAFETI